MKIASVFVLVGVFGFFAYSLYHRPIHDFANSYFPAQFQMQGKLDSTIFDPGEFNKRIAATGQSGVMASFNPNPPSVAVLFIPFAALEIHLAKILFIGLSFFFFAVSIYHLCNFYSVPWEKCFLLVPFIFFLPLKTNILFGQSYLLVTALLIEGFLSYKAEKILASSFFWAFASFLKVFPLIIFLFLIMRKKKKQALVLAGLLTVMTCVFITIQGVSLWEYYLLEVLPRSLSGDLHAAFTASTQSMVMFLKYSFVADAVFNESPWLNSAIVFFMALGLFSSIVVATLIQFIRREDEVKSFWLMIFASMLLSPQGSTYSTILLLPLLLAFYSKEKLDQWFVIGVLVLIVANIPLSIFKTLPLLFRFPRLWMLVLLLIILMIQTKVYPRIRTILILLPFFVGPRLIQNFLQKDESITYVDYEWKPLITDYKIVNGQIYVTWLDALGEHLEASGKKITPLADQSCSIVNNQILFKGGQVTNTSDNKRKPVAVNDHEILYLSDKGKGVGFFAIRKLTIR